MPVDETDLDTIRVTADDPANPKLKIGAGSQAALTGILGAFVMFITAAINAGGEWYQDNGVVTLGVAFVAATAAFLTNRSSQANTVVKAGISKYQAVVTQLNDVVAAYEKAMAAAGITPPPPGDGGGGGVVVNPPTTEPVPATPGDIGTTPGPGTEG